MRATIKRVDGTYYRDYQLYLDGWFVTLVMFRKEKYPEHEAERELRQRAYEQLRLLRKVQRGLNRLGEW